MYLAKVKPSRMAFTLFQPLKLMVTKSPLAGTVRQTSSGGILVYVQDDISCSRRPGPEITMSP